MAEQVLSPSDLYGSGILNTIALGGTITTLSTTNQYTYFFQGSDAQTDWNSVITAASSPNVNTINPHWAALITGRGANPYLNARIMGEFNLSSISGTISSITATLTTDTTGLPPTPTAVDINLYDAGTTGLAGVGGEYSYYRDEGEVKFSDTAQELSLPSTYFFTLNTAALTVANTKPSSFVIAAVNSFDFNSTAPTPIDTIYGYFNINTIALRVTHS